MAYRIVRTVSMSTTELPDGLREATPCAIQFFDAPRCTILAFRKLRRVTLPSRLQDRGSILVELVVREASDHFVDFAVRASDPIKCERMIN